MSAGYRSFQGNHHRRGSSRGNAQPTPFRSDRPWHPVGCSQSRRHVRSDRHDRRRAGGQARQIEGRRDLDQAERHHGTGRRYALTLSSVFHDRCSSDTLVRTALFRNADSGASDRHVTIATPHEPSTSGSASPLPPSPPSHGRHFAVAEKCRKQAYSVGDVAARNVFDVTKGRARILVNETSVMSVSPCLFLASRYSAYSHVGCMAGSRNHISAGSASPSSFRLVPKSSSSQNCPSSCDSLVHPNPALRSVSLHSCTRRPACTQR